MISHSSTYGGISILFKVSVVLTQLNFKNVWNHISDTVLNSERLDINCTNINRRWLIPYDPDVYFNDTNQIVIDINEIKVKVNAKQCIMYSSFINTLSCTYKIHDIRNVLEVIKLQSEIVVENRVMDFTLVDTCKVFIPKQIPDGKKRSTYGKMIHQLAYLNPGIDPSYLFSFIYFVNQHYAIPVMPIDKLKSYFEFVYGEIVRTGIVKPLLKKKRVHFNSTSGHSKREKNVIANKLNGLYKKMININKIMDAKNELLAMGKEVTTKTVAELTGMKRRTVQLYFYCERIDLQNELDKINSSRIEPKN